ncbi:MAG: peptidylprolyl isomerase [Bacteroidales bacterium]|nr:peptidylprolyl isomerase [Bacteroidales bacterium]
MSFIRSIILISLVSIFSEVYSQEISSNTDYLVTINTDFGKIKLILFEDTPLHKKNFLELAKAGVYDHIIFHRVINRFMIQTGDYTTRNQAIDYDPRVIKDPIPAEIHPHYTHIRGAIGTARKGDDENPERKSNSTQFYIIQNYSGAHHLDGKYTIFGQVMSGFEVIDIIAEQQTTNKDRPVKNIRILVDIDQVSRSDIEKFYNFTY